MVAFRKSALLAMSVLLLGAGSAFGQQQGFQPLQCTANAGVPPVVRAEGLTELVGDLVITCTGGNPATPFLANFQLFLNTQITSRLVGANLSEALLMIDEPGLPRNNVGGGAGTPTPFCLAPETVAGQQNQNTAGFTPTVGVAPLVASPACNPVAAAGTETFQTGTYTVFRANRIQDVGGSNNQAFQTALQWPGVPVTPPGTNRQRIFRITNVRANANGLNVSQTFFPTPITAFVSVSPQGTLPIDQPQQTVGVVQQGLVFDVRNAGNTGSLTTGLDQCVSASANRDFFSNPNRETGTLPAFGVFRFREGFPTAFKPQILPGQDAANPGVVFNSESGFVRTAVLGTAGVADSGTRLSVRFQNVPANLNIFVSTRNVYALTQTVGTVTTRVNDAVFVTADANGATLSGGVIRTPTAPFGIGTTTIASGAESSSLVQVPITAGSGTATWEVIASNPSANEDFQFFFGLGYTNANPSTGSNQQVGLGIGQVIGNLAPFYAATGNAIQMAGFGLPIPRFASRTDATTFVNVTACQTNLLFPFVTNRVGFDTGMAIANTSEDMFSDPQNRRQAGRCRLNYFGRLANGNPPSPASEQTDREIAAGETITLVLSTGGDAGLRGSATFQGYIIAQCDFRFGHGFAFITDGPVGQARVAEGYLALVLDGGDEQGRLRGQSQGENRGH